MKIGLFTVPFAFSGMNLEATLDYVAPLGVEAVELGAGNYPGNHHCVPDQLLGNATARKALLKAVESRGMQISALSCHGNPLHPDPKIGKDHHQTWRKVVQLAEKLGINVVINFSGCPGDSDTAKHPNWVTCPWPDDFTTVVNWQWKNKVIPYWKAESKFAQQHKVKVAFEMHPGFVVYNPETLLKLRHNCGDNLGANFDPSHLFWQGICPSAAVRALKDCIYHVHAKDSRVDPINGVVNGVLDTKPYTDEINRSWIFRTVGYGHDFSVWKDLISTLRLIGYDNVLSIEHEDSLMSSAEGLKKAISFLKEVVIREKPGEAYWA